MNRVEKVFNLLTVSLTIFFSLNTFANEDQKTEDRDENNNVIIEYPDIINENYITVNKQEIQNITVVHPYYDYDLFASVRATLIDFALAGTNSQENGSNYRVSLIQSSSTETENGTSYTSESILLIDSPRSDSKESGDAKPIKQEGSSLSI
ncbi:MAG: hypothetical protein AB8G05_24325 [Oligoflexales bacterium]